MLHRYGIPHKSALIAAIFLLSHAMAFAQTTGQKNGLVTTLGKLAESAAEAYVAPVVSGFGANLNSGWVHRVPAPVKTSLDLELGVVGMGSFFSASSKSFNTEGSFKFNYNQADLLIPRSYTGAYRDSIRSQLMKIPFTVSISGPTIVGSKLDTVHVSYSGGTVSVSYQGVNQSITLNPLEVSTGVTGFLENLKLLPMGAFQLSAGTLFGTAVTVRFLPTSNLNGKLGNTSYFGFGIQHNPLVWFGNSIPVNLSLAYFTQTLKIGTVFKSTASDYGIYASKSFGPGLLNITPFAGLSIQSSKMTVSYDFQTTGPRNEPISIPISFSLTGQNTACLTLGFSLKLLILNISTEYDIAKYNSASLGVGLIY
ncbi:MAG: hypothetical protein M1339_06465 [Bacteroidetes bacterium]|nr:hypothetical protein [Bacteroidota bacterium]